jgi:hypothetical protein
MTIRTRLLLMILAAGLALPSGALAATSASSSCLDTRLSVATAAGTSSGTDTITATVVALGSVGQRISRLHLDLEVQERTAATWVEFQTAQHVKTFTNYPGSHLHRMWTLREDGGPIFALLDNHVQMRVYARFQGICRGESLGGPLLFGLSAPTIGAPPAS